MNVITNSHKDSILDEGKEQQRRLEEMKEAIRVAYQDELITSDEMELLDRQWASLGVTVEEYLYCFKRIFKEKIAKIRD